MLLLLFVWQLWYQHAVGGGENAIPKENNETSDVATTVIRSKSVNTLKRVTGYTFTFKKYDPTGGVQRSVESTYEGEDGIMVKAPEHCPTVTATALEDGTLVAETYSQLPKHFSLIDLVSDGYAIMVNCNERTNFKIDPRNDGEIFQRYPRFDIDHSTGNVYLSTISRLTLNGDEDPVGFKLLLATGDENQSSITYQDNRYENIIQWDDDKHHITYTGGWWGNIEIITDIDGGNLSIIRH